MKKPCFFASIAILMTQFASVAQDNYAQWTYYRNVILNTKATGAGVALTETMFPVLVRLGPADSNVFKNAQAKGQDIRFAKYNGRHLNYQIEQWDATDRIATIWVQADTVFGNDSVAYMNMYWGNSAAADSQNGPAVFDTVNGGFDVVWHLNGNWNDVGGIHMHTHAQGTFTDTPAVIDSGEKFILSHSLTTGNYFTDSTLQGTPAAYTISLWVKEDSSGNSAAEILTMGDCALIRDDSLCDGKGSALTGMVRIGSQSQNYNFAPPPSRIKHKGWEYVASTYNPNITQSMNLYLNGALIAFTNGPMTQYWTEGYNFTRMAYNASNAYFGFQGVMNEVRIDRVARDSNWVKLCFQNQTNGMSQPLGRAALPPQTLVSLGPPINISIPANLSYSQNPATYLCGTPITPNTPIVTGVPTGYSISSLLPSGLSLNSSTGVITGTPLQAAAQTIYTVTAGNSFGSTSCGLQITVQNASAAISANPASLTVAENATAKFGVMVSGSPPFHYSWTNGSGGLFRDTTSDCAFTDTLRIVGVQASNDGAVFTCQATGSIGGPVSSAAATLSVSIEPALASPANNATGVTTSPTLSWNSVAGPPGMYYVQVSTSSAFAVNAINDSSATLSKAESATLAFKTVYYWRVAAKRNGVMSLWSNWGGSPWQFTTTYPVPAAPVLGLPADNAAGVALTPKLSWNSAAGVSSYLVQLSSVASFAALTIDSMLDVASDSITTALMANTRYYWRVNASNTAGTSAWTADSFTTILNSPVAIGVKNGWNIISLNIHAQDSLTADVIGALKGFVLAKTLTQFYWPAQGLDGFDTLHTTQGYQMFCDSADTIHASGIPVNVAATPIPMTAGWNMIAYLPQAAIGVDTATTGIASQLVLVKNSAGQVYWPDTNYNLNSIGRMQPGQGYQIYMTAAASFTYPSGSAAKGLALSKRENVYLPAPKHFALALNTGSNATIVSRRVGINGAIAPDSSEVGVFDGKGNLVGAGVVMRGAAAFSVWGRSEQIKGAAGLAASEPLSFKLWNGKREYPLEFHGSAPAVYAKDAIFIGNFVVPSALFINKFALANAYPNPFRENIRIYFDVPAAAGNAPQEVRIDVYDLRGSVVARLAGGKFMAGHYSVAWDGGSASALGSDMYIVEMKANNFEKMLRLFRVK